MGDNIQIDQDSEEYSTSKDSSSDGDSEQDNEFSYIESLIRGVPMIPKGLTTSKPKKKSANVIVPGGYGNGEVEEVLRIKSHGTNGKKRNSFRVWHASEIRKSPSVEKPKYLELPSSAAANKLVDSEVNHRSIDNNQSDQESGN